MKLLTMLFAVAVLAVAGCKEGPAVNKGEGAAPPAVPAQVPQEEEEEPSPALAEHMAAASAGGAQMQSGGQIEAAPTEASPGEANEPDVVTGTDAGAPPAAAEGDVSEKPETAEDRDVKESVDVGDLPAGPVDPKKSLKVFEEAKKLIESGKTDKAISLFEEWLKLAPTDMVNRKNLVHVYLSMEKYEDASLHLKILTDQDPPDKRELLAALGRAQAKLAKHTQAAEALALALSMDPSDVDVALDLARNLSATREYPKAVAVLEAALKRGKKEIEVLKELGAALVLSGEYSRAGERYRKLQKLQPSVETAVMIADISMQQARCDDAIDALAGWDKEFKDEKPFVLLADCALQAKDVAKAQKLLSLAVEKNGQCFDCALKLGDVFFEKGEWDNASQLYAKAAEMSPQDGRSFAQLGKSLANAGRHMEATRAFKSATERFPKDADLLFALGVESSAAGEKAEAWKVWGTLDELDKVKAAELRKLLTK